MAEQGQTLRAICRDEAMPDKSTVLRWATADVAFRASYTLALAARADDWADEMLEIADEGRGACAGIDCGSRRDDAFWPDQRRSATDEFCDHTCRVSPAQDKDLRFCLSVAGYPIE